MVLGLGMATLETVAAIKAPPGFASAYNTALVQAKRENKPVILHFTTDRSVACRKIEQEFYTNAKCQDALDAFVPTSLDCSNNAPYVRNNKALLETYGGSDYPFFVVLAPDGAVLGTWSGMLPLESFLQRINQTKQEFDRYDAFLEKAKTADQKSLDFHLESVDIYLATRQWSKMDAAVKTAIRLDTDHSHLGRIKLAQLQAAAAKKDTRAVNGLVGEIRQLDPDNAGRHLEAALKEQASFLVRQISSAPHTLESQYKKALAILTERAALPNLKDSLEAKVAIGILQANVNKFKEARATLETILSEKLDNEQAEKIKRILDVIKEMESQKK